MERINWDEVQVNSGVADRCFFEAEQIGPGKECSSASAVNHPDHYALGREIEPIAAIEDWQLNFSLGSAVKYISRAGRKDPTKTIEDLEKAVWYLEREISRLRKI